MQISTLSSDHQAQPAQELGSSRQPSSLKEQLRGTRRLPSDLAARTLETCVENLELRTGCKGKPRSQPGRQSGVDPHRCWNRCPSRRFARCFLLPSLEVTEMENILMFKDLTVYMKVFCQTFTAYRGRVQSFLFKKSANSCVIRVPLATKFQSLLTFFPVCSFNHFLLFIFRKQALPLRGKS